MRTSEIRRIRKMSCNNLINSVEAKLQRISALSESMDDMRPVQEDALSRMKAQLKKRASAMKSPLDRTYDVYDLTEDIFFHFGLSKLHKNTII